MSGEQGADIDCADFVELITDYLDGALSEADRTRIDAHLSECPGCTNALAQWRAVVRLSGRVSEQDVERLDAATRAALFDVFRASPSREDRER
jgi:anti-sigma factor RsiW